MTLFDWIRGRRQDRSAIMLDLTELVDLTGCSPDDILNGETDESAHTTAAMAPRSDRCPDVDLDADKQDLYALAAAGINAYMAFNLLPMRHEEDMRIVRSCQVGLEEALNQAIGPDWRDIPPEVEL